MVVDKMGCPLNVYNISMMGLLGHTNILSLKLPFAFAFIKLHIQPNQCHVVISIN